MRFPPTESNEFPNDNPRLHQGASWVCLDPLATPRAVARPDVIAKAAIALSTSQTPASQRASGRPRTTLLPPAVSEETEQLVARFIARVTAPPPPNAAQSALRLLPIAQFMLDELPNYRVRRQAASVPPPPAHVYAGLPSSSSIASSEGQPEAPDQGEVSEPAGSSEIRELRCVDSLRLELAEQPESPLSLVESWLPPSTDSAMKPPKLLQDLALEAISSAWCVMTPSVQGFVALGWDRNAPPTLARSEPDETVSDTVLPPPNEELRSESLVVMAQIILEAPDLTEPVVASVSDAPGHASQPPAGAEAACAVASDPTTAPVQEGVNDYATFVAALSEILLLRGATRGAAMVRNILEDSRIEAATLGETLVEQLAAAGIGEARGEHFMVHGAFGDAALGWRSLLAGESTDFSSCAETLDDWATRLVKALLPSPVPSPEIRRELRRRGVAAFGMLAAA